MEQSIFFFTILALILAGYYSLVTFPRQREFQKHHKLILNLQEGDPIITSGGIIGKITEITPETGLAKIEIAEGLEIQMITAAIRKYDPDAIGTSTRRALGAMDEEVAE